MKTQKTIEERIIVLENKIRNPAGTSICRCLKKDSGIQWSLGMGQMGTPLQFFYGDTIEDVVSQAEKQIQWQSKFIPYTINDALYDAVMDEL